MRQSQPRGPRASRIGVAVALAVFAGGLAVPSATAAPESAREPVVVDDRTVTSEIGLATKAYVEEFWPLWLSFEQQKLGGSNSLVGPDTISPVYKAIVAINDDTLYGSSFVDLKTGPGGTDEPVIVTVPAAASDLSYSVLSLDMFGDVQEGGIPSKSAGSASVETVYAIVPEGYAGTIPAGAIELASSLDFFILIFRVDKYTDGVDRETEASAFRENIRLQTLSEYDIDLSGGVMDIVTEDAFGLPFKTIADDLVQTFPVAYLTMLQEAVQSSSTPPLSVRELAIAAEFDNLFGQGGANVTLLSRLEFERGARAGHDAIVANYLDNRGDNNWIHFSNIGKWANDEALDRSSIAEYIQWGNDISAAAYYHTFLDGNGNALTGADDNSYVLTFPAGEEPPNERFWSLTAYTPDAIELIDNPIDKYVVASYTPDLEMNDDGSLSIYIAESQPEGVPEANWLPVSNDDFNVMLRIYGVPDNSSVADNTYRPPAVLQQTSFATLDTAERIADTRSDGTTIDGVSAGGGPIPRGTFIEVPVVGRGSIPSTGLDAVVVNATAVNSESNGFFTTYPCEDRPLASSLNYSVADSAVANEVIAKLSTDGSICIYAHATTDLVLDAVGYVETTSTYTSLTSARVLDTRPGGETIDGESAGGGPIQARMTIEVPMLGRGGVPESGVDTVVVNATATAGENRGFVTIFPCGELPLASSMNFPNNTTAVANEVIAKLSDDGTLCAYANATTDLVLDVVGYFASTPTYTSLKPARMLETREGRTTVDGQFAEIGAIEAGTSVEVSVLGRGEVPSSDVATIVLNATATDAVRRGFVTIYDCGDLPATSSLNYPAGSRAVANEVLATLSADGTVCAYAHTTTELILDAVGYIPS